MFTFIFYTIFCIVIVLETGIGTTLPKGSLITYILGMICLSIVGFIINPAIGIGVILMAIFGVMKQLTSKKIDTSKKQEIKPYLVTNPYIRIKEDGKCIEYKMVNGRMETTQI